MKHNTKRRTLGMAMVLIIGAMGWGIVQVVAQGDMDMQMMEMMKKMMMNRPKAMMNADKAIQDQKATAMKESKYACCLKHACDSCALKMGQCPCGMNAANDKPVCNECKGSWYAGDGAVPGKTADQIKTMPRPMGGM
jgi:hypothetical protein